MTDRPSKDPASPLLRSDAAFQLYLTALIKSGYQSSVNAAARRRDTLLSTTQPSPPSADHSSAATLADPSKLSDSTPTSTSEKTPHAYPPTSSQHIAQAVMAAAGSNSLPFTHSQSPDMSRLQAAFKGVGGMGVQGNPLVVTVSEREQQFYFGRLHEI
jgi:ATP-dependent metalloprotease